MKPEPGFKEIFGVVISKRTNPRFSILSLQARLPIRGAFLYF